MRDGDALTDSVRRNLGTRPGREADPHPRHPASRHSFSRVAVHFRCDWVWSRWRTPGDPHDMPPPIPSPRCSRGQAAVELVAVLPLVALVLAAAGQAVLAGYAVWQAHVAARSAARAAAVGADPRAAA